MSMDVSGMEALLVSLERKFLAMEWMRWASGPVQESHEEAGLTWSIKYKTSDPSRCGVLCMAHVAKRRRRVALSLIDWKRASTCFSTLSMAVERKALQKSGDPAGCPRTRRPVVTSTGVVAVGSEAVGHGSEE
jgi:hypothetical protein